MRLILTPWREPGCVREILELAQEMISVDHHGEEGESSGDADRRREEEDVASNIVFVVVIVTSAALRSS